MASTTWHIQGIDTGGNELALNQIQPWSASGPAVPLTITSTFPPVSGALDDLLIADSTACVFAAADVQKPGFAIVFTFNTAVDLWGFRFAGPSDNTWPLQHSIRRGTGSATVSKVQWVSGGLSPAPTRQPSFTMPFDEMTVQTAAGTRNWEGCAVSADGAVMLASVYTGGLWLSKDGGTTWVEQVAAGTRYWRGCAVSADGLVLLGVGYSTPPVLSKDGGATWVAQTAAGTRNWYECAVSADGAVMLASVYTGGLWLSKDGGITWVEQVAAGTRDWRGCAVSADGSVLICGAERGNLWLSKDGGATWVAQTAAGTRNWFGCAISTDGAVMLAVVNAGSAWLSKNGGITWAEQTAVGTRGWYGCAVSADSTALLALASGGSAWLSKDGGGTWVAQTAAGNRDWRRGGVSADGSVILASVYAGGLWLAISQDGIYLPNTPRTYTPHVAVSVQGLPPDAQGTLNTYAAEAVQFNDLEFSGSGRVYGTVERKNTPANVPLRRRVRLHRSRDGMLVRETWSKPDGSYEFKHVSMHYEYDAIAWDHEMSYRSVIANNLKPEAM